MALSIENCACDDRLNALLLELEAWTTTNDAATKQVILRQVRKEIEERCSTLDKTSPKALSKVSLVRLFD